ncbi:hypothetical protein [Lentzea sp. NPDC092896]|uniref:hypothetical protein n=1 Tax=Lentzea sp. NPDC092896 TaxID=3364127 RepID=UPI003824BDB4
MEAILFIIFLFWFFSGRLLSDLQTLGRRALAWGADKVAALAQRHAARSPRFAPFVAKLAQHGAAKLRNRPSPTDPRTSNGQQAAQAAFEGAGVVAAAGVALMLLWVRIAVADAIGAAQSAGQPRATENDSKWAWAASWVAWARWPKPGEPNAPVYATAQRTDRPPPLALPAGTSTAGSTNNTGFTTHWRSA